MPSRERSFHTEAVVLRHSDWGEADRILTLFTQKAGKIRAIAKGARKARSRKAGHLEPFTRVNIMLAQGRDLQIVTQVETVVAFLPIREDLMKTGYAAYVIELLDRFTYEEGENQRLYRLLVETLERVSEEADPLLAVRYYEIHLLDILGFRPHLFQCAICQAEIQAEDQFYSAAQGGVLCPNCGPRFADSRPISMNALRFMRHLQRSSYPEASRAKIPAPVQKEMETILQHNLTYLLERSLNSPAFLRAVTREN